MSETRYSGRFAERTAQVGELRIAYTDWNSGGSNIFLLVHGLYGHRHVWDPIADALSERHRVICPDLRGHGESAWSRDGYWTRNFVADLHGLLRELGAGPALYVGHSLGARIGYAFSAEHPSDLSGMVLSDAAPETPRLAASRVTAAIGQAAATHGFHSREQAREQFAAEHPEWQPEFHALDALYQLRENWAGKYVYRHDPDLYWITRSAGKKEGEYLWQSARRNGVRTLIVRGERSPYFTDELLARLLREMPNAAATTLPTGHYVPREDPQGFVRTLLEFAQAR